MTKFDAADMSDLAVGAALLGSGGGGDPHIGRLLAEQAIAGHGPVNVVPLSDVPDDATVFPIAMMGAPTVMHEKPPATGQAARTVTALATYLGEEPTHIACAEAGGVNSTIPFTAAAELGLPLIDADGMGRAFPELQMVLPTLAGIQAGPLALSDEKGNSAIIDVINNSWAERLARSATVEMGTSAMVSLYHMNGRQCRESFAPGTLSLCVELGRAVRHARSDGDDPVAATAAILNGRIVGAGKVLDVERRTTAGFARGVATIEGVNDYQGQTIVIRFQNENLIAEIDGNAVVTTPDLIIISETDTGEPITSETLRFGQRVRIIAAPAHPHWHTPAGYDLVGPRYFGYEIDPIPVHAGGTQ